MSHIVKQDPSSRISALVSFRRTAFHSRKEHEGHCKNGLCLAWDLISDPHAVRVCACLCAHGCMFDPAAGLEGWLQVQEAGRLVFSFEAGSKQHTTDIRRFHNNTWSCRMSLILKNKNEWWLFWKIGLDACVIWLIITFTCWGSSQQRSFSVQVRSLDESPEVKDSLTRRRKKRNFLLLLPPRWNHTHLRASFFPFLPSLMGKERRAGGLGAMLTRGSAAGGLQLQGARAFVSSVQWKHTGGSSSAPSCPSNDGRRPGRTWASERPTPDRRADRLGAPRTATHREDSSCKHDFRLNADSSFTLSAGICKANSGVHTGTTLPPSAGCGKWVKNKSWVFEGLLHHWLLTFMLSWVWINNVLKKIAFYKFLVKISDFYDSFIKTF